MQVVQSLDDCAPEYTRKYGIVHAYKLPRMVLKCPRMF